MKPPSDDIDAGWVWLVRYRHSQGNDCWVCATEEIALRHANQIITDYRDEFDLDKDAEIKWDEWYLHTDYDEDIEIEHVPIHLK